MVENVMTSQNSVSFFISTILDDCYITFKKRYVTIKRELQWYDDRELIYISIDKYLTSYIKSCDCYIGQIEKEVEKYNVWDLKKIFPNTNFIENDKNVIYGGEFY